MDDGARVVIASVAAIPARARRIDTVDAFMAHFPRRVLKVSRIQTFEAADRQSVSLRMAGDKDDPLHTHHPKILHGLGYVCREKE